jgi:hypothetical protein
MICIEIPLFISLDIFSVFLVFGLCFPLSFVVLGWLVVRLVAQLVAISNDESSQKDIDIHRKEQQCVLWSQSI